MQNPFLVPPEQYTRDVDELGHYVTAQASFISRKYGRPFLDVKKWVLDSIKPDGCNPLKDPKIQYIQQVSRGNREVKVSTLKEYIDELRSNDYTMAPTLTAYLNPNQKKSLLAEFIFGNVKARSEYKVLAGSYKQQKNNILGTYFNILQGSVKEENNSLSGAHSSKYNILYNASGHPSLTSTCRSATSYANASNERFLAGNRHYHDVDVVLQELSNAEVLAPHDLIMEVVEEYNLHIPTFDEVFKTAKKSFTKYWVSKRREELIKEFIDTMSDAARVAFVYVGDMYHLDVYNKEFIDVFFKDLMSCSQTNNPSNSEDFLSKTTSDMIALISYLQKDTMVGEEFKKVKAANGDKYNILNNTYIGLDKMISRYSKFIDALWRPRYLQSSIGQFRGIVREAVLTSDTDSTIFTTMYWTIRITGSANFDKASYDVCFLVVYFASQMVANSLGLLCANLGVTPDLIPKLAMKNEYYFSVYLLTNIMKHYCGLKDAQEGAVFTDSQLEMKGVGFITSKIAEDIMDRFQAYVKDTILAAIRTDIYLTPEFILAPVIAQEREIRDGIRAGGYEIYSTEQVKNKESYKAEGNNATYKQFVMWQEVFAPKYGYVDEPPLSTLKIPVDLDKKRKIAAWLDAIEDKAVAIRMKDYLDRNNKSDFTSIQVPLQLALSGGIPKELVMVVDEKRATKQIMSPYYMFLESLGLYHANSKDSKLLTDNYYPPILPNYVDQPTDL